MRSIFCLIDCMRHSPKYTRNLLLMNCCIFRYRHRQPTYSSSASHVSAIKISRLQSALICFRDMLSTECIHSDGCISTYQRINHSIFSVGTKLQSEMKEWKERISATRAHIPQSQVNSLTVFVVITNGIQGTFFSFFVVPTFSLLLFFLSFSFVVSYANFIVFCNRAYYTYVNCDTTRKMIIASNNNNKY